MNDCIFCKIAKGEADSYLINENENFMAFMDIFPPIFDGKVTSPVVIVIPKEHYKSNLFEDLTGEVYKDVLEYAKRIAQAIQKALNPLRVCLVSEGMELEHFHLKLYPIFRETYPGYLSTKKGLEDKNIMADSKFLKETADKIKMSLRRF